MPLHVHFRWGVALVEEFSTGFCSPRRVTTLLSTREDDAPSRPRVRRRAGCGLEKYFCKIY